MNLGELEVIVHAAKAAMRLSMVRTNLPTEISSEAAEDFCSMLDVTLSAARVCVAHDRDYVDFGGLLSRHLAQHVALIGVVTRHHEGRISALEDRVEKLEADLRAAAGELALARRRMEGDKLDA